MPTAMIFVPCKDGLSHNELEDATQSDCAAGANVLLHTTLALAGVASGSGAEIAVRNSLHLGREIHRANF